MWLDGDGIMRLVYAPGVEATLNTPIIKMLADLYTRLNRPPYPVKYFVSEAQAWSG